MRVTVEGVITSIEQKVKEDKKYTELLLAQKGEKMQVPVRVPGHVADQYDLFQVEKFSGSLIAWKTRDGIGMLINVMDESA